MQTDEVQTVRLELAPLNPDRLGTRYAEWLNDPAVNQYLESRLGEQTPETVRRYVADNNTSKNAVLMGIFERVGGQHVGNIRISEISWSHGHAEIGLLIGEKDRWGRGYAQEAIQAATTLAFERLNLRKLVAGCYASNAGSVRAFQRCGYRQVGCLHAHWKAGERFDDQLILERLA